MSDLIHSSDLGPFSPKNTFSKEWKLRALFQGLKRWHQQVTARERENSGRSSNEKRLQEGREKPNLKTELRNEQAVELKRRWVC